MDEKRADFVKLSFSGQRFVGARLPADASVNISIYQDILIELAKQIWREKNPNRLRLPRNFARYFQLQVGEITEGSAVAHLPRFEEDLPQLFGSMEPGDIFDLAQEKLIEIVDSANKDEAIPRLSRPARQQLGRIRENLRGTEDLIVTRGRRKRSEDRHRISKQTKESITRVLREERVEPIDGFGIVTGVSDNPPSVTVNSEHGSLTFPVNFKTAKTEFAGQNGRLAEFNVVATLNYDGEAKRLESVNSLNLVVDNQQMLRAVRRVDMLGGLEMGWHDGVGEEISELTILYAKDIARFVSMVEPSLGIFPTLDGAITMEYSRNSLEWTITIVEKNVYLEVLSIENDESFTNRFVGPSMGLMKALLSENGIVDNF